MLVGLATGVLSSLFTAWLLIHRARPSIEFAEEVSVRNGSLRVKVRNAGRRSMWDVETRAVFRVKSVDPALPSNALHVEVPVDDAYMPNWPPHRETSTDRVFVLLPEDASRYHRSLLQSSNLPELLGADASNSFRIITSVTNGLTGTRSTISSKPYTALNVREASYVVGDLRLRPLE